MSAHPDYMGVWCPTCQEDCLPIHGKCGFCDTRVIERESSPSVVAVIEPPQPKEEPVTLTTCKHPGCERPPADRRGMYGGLCAVHKAEKRAARVGKPKAVRPIAALPPPVAEPELTNGNGHTPVTLTELAQAVEQARANLNDRITDLRAALDAA